MGETDAEKIRRILDPKILKAQIRESLAKLDKMGESGGGIPWWPGGTPSPHMTLYVLDGLSRTLDLGVDVPKGIMHGAWNYLHRYYEREIVPRAFERGCCRETVTLLGYVLSNYPDIYWGGNAFTKEERERMLDFSFKHWKGYSPLLKSYLALTLHRKGRQEDAKLVFDSVMDSAISDPDLGTYWVPENRPWLWYNDTIENHAFTLRALSELYPEDGRRQGIVQWILLDKKMNHWKSTRATAEVIYSLVQFLEQEDQLGVREEVLVEVGDHQRTFVFEPHEYTGKKNQWVFEEEEVTPDMGTITVEKDTPGLLFASATWHFSTEKLPEKGEGDFFSVDRFYFRRFHDGEGVDPSTHSEMARRSRWEINLKYSFPYARSMRRSTYTSEIPGCRLRTRDLDLRFPLANRALGYYEEVRDSGANFFFEWLPVGEYTFKYRLRAATAGKFRVGPGHGAEYVRTGIRGLLRRPGRGG